MFELFLSTRSPLCWSACLAATLALQRLQLRDWAALDQVGIFMRQRSRAFLSCSLLTFAEGEEEICCAAKGSGCCPILVASCHLGVIFSR